MKIENEIFKRTTIIFESLASYGFIRTDDIYVYRKIFMNSLEAVITVNKEGAVDGKVYDLEINDEYTNFRIESQDSGFLNIVREEYKKILYGIKSKCFEEYFFITNQANRITKEIAKKFNDDPEFPWAKFPKYGVFRNSSSDKWYAAILAIDKSKVAKDSYGEIEIINVKLEESRICSLLNENGVYPAYHMSKKSWISIILDDTLSDDIIMELVSVSHVLTSKK